MQTEIVFSGFGGQGALFAGQLLAHAALEADQHVTWIPSYGPEMRGGTAHCIVIVSEAEIGSPVVRNPKAAVVLNLPSLDKYEPLVKAGGVLIVNQSLVDRTPARPDVDVAMIPAIEEAEAIGDRRLLNVILLGALLQRLPILSIEAIGVALDHHIPAHRRNLIPANLKALARGYELAAQTVTVH